MAEQRIGLDANCLSYLIDAASAVVEPVDELAGERKALLRVWFYGSGRFYVSETVLSECARIRDIALRELHRSFGAITYWGMTVKNIAEVSKRTTNSISISLGL